MLQDLAYGRLENEYRPVPPESGDRILCYRPGSVLLYRGPEGASALPTLSQLPRKPEELRYLFRLHGSAFFLCMEQPEETERLRWHPVRDLRQMPDRTMCYAAWTGWHLFNWYKNSRFCGCCGAETVHDEKERMMRCPSCGNMIFPRINPAVIVAVTDGDRLLMTKYAGRGHTSYALIAGFTEIGETIEQTVHREVLEEVGVRVKNLRYYRSQPWGIDGNVLMGFYCDLDGDSAIHLDETELSFGGWYDRSELPIGDDGISLTREMIRVFGEGKEPK